MGFLDNLFPKKFCSLCGKKVSLFGYSNLTNGLICKSCKALLSPYYSWVRTSSVSDIQRHIAYREENLQQLKSFRATRVLGTDNESVYVDDESQYFCISRSAPSPSSNADLFALRCIRDCEVRVDETEKELTYYDSEKQKTRSYSPPRYEYTRSIALRIHLEGHAWLNSFTMRCGKYTFQNRAPITFDKMLQNTEEIRETLLQASRLAKNGPAPKRSMLCSHCGATTVPDAQGRCEYCMSALN